MSQTGLSLKGFFSQEAVKSKFAELLGKKATGFVTSVMQVVSTNTLLAKADMNSIYQAAAMAATLDLPINNNLGHAWIVPYGNKAQFQIGWKGFVQLAQRTGQYKRINVAIVYENQFERWNELTEDLKADFSIHGTGNVIGYVAYFALINGFEKTSFWYKERVESHGKRYSKSYNSGPWGDNFDAMALKTVIKSTISKWGPLSIELQKAFSSDQSVIEDLENEQFEYPDNEPTEKETVNQELDRALSVLYSLRTEEEINEFSFNVHTDQWSQEDTKLFIDSIAARKIYIHNAQ